MSRICYLAEPIDYGTADQTSVEMALNRLTHSWLIYRPRSAWSGGDIPIGPEPEEVNRSVLMRSGLLVAFLPTRVKSVGVPREIEFAKFMGIHTIVVTDAPGWALADCETVTLEEFQTMRLPIPHLGSPLDTPDPSNLQFHLSEGARLPTRANAGDAGFDLYTDRDSIVRPGIFTDISCGVQVALPEGIWARLTGRSSTMRTWNLLTIDSVIDTGYRGDLFSAVWNMTNKDIFVPAGTRLTQLILHANLASEYVPESATKDEFNKIPGDGRGLRGFGSSGT